MSKQSQKEAVYSAVVSVLTENNITFTEGMDVNSVMTKELRAQVTQILFEGFKGNSIELDRVFNDTDLRAYISGLQSNWLRKDSRLNGGSKFSVKNPGSRLGASDPSIKAMRTLLSTLSSEQDRNEVQAAINNRLAEIQSTKVKKVSIDTNLLPESLRSKVNS